MPFFYRGHVRLASLPAPGPTLGTRGAMWYLGNLEARMSSVTSGRRSALPAGALGREGTTRSSPVARPVRHEGEVDLGKNKTKAEKAKRNREYALKFKKKRPTGRSMGPRRPMSAAPAAPAVAAPAAPVSAPSEGES